MPFRMHRRLYETSQQLMRQVYLKLPEVLQRQLQLFQRLRTRNVHLRGATRILLLFFRHFENIHQTSDNFRLLLIRGTTK